METIRQTTEAEKMNEAPVVIDVQNAKKKFMVYYDRGATLKERILFKNRRRHEEHWVLKGISFQVRKGEAVGLIGENGCGKSTTLKMLTKILYPDEGSIKMKGRVSSLIELGAGFHPDMSGRENIYTNASIFGLKKEEIDKRLQGIIDFSELGDYIDNPVRTYSSGMYMRLAFAVAINVDADILLIDEILAVGDAAFQAKCFNKLREIKQKGTTIVIVSHSMSQIEQFCERSIWIEGGLIREQGNPIDVHQKYLRYMSEKTGTLSSSHKESKGNSPDPTGKLTDVAERWGNRDITFTAVRIVNDEGKCTNLLQSGKSFSIQMDYLINRPIENLCLGIGIFRVDGLQCYGTNTMIDHHPIELKEKQGTVIFQADYNNLIESDYSLDVAFEKAGGFPYDFCRGCLRFTVRSDIKDVGICRIKHSWLIK